MSIEFPLIAIVVLAVLIGLIAIVLRNRVEEQDISESTPDAGSEDVPRKSRAYLAVALGLTVLAVGGMVVFMSTRGDGTGGGGDSSVVSFIPIWVAVFVPILAQKKGEKKNISGTQKRVLVIIVGLTVALVFGTIMLMIGNS